MTPLVASFLHPALPGNGQFRRGMVVSLLFHLLVLGGIPLLMQITRQSVRFERPPTFQLVTAPPTLRPLKPAQAKLTKQRAPAKIKKESVRPVPRESDAAQENLDELASLLDEIPAPARVATLGDFKYNWYLANVQQKISRFWNPPSENRNLSVVVSFTINRDGSISAPSVSEGSGNGTLDNLAVRAVTLAAPFGKLPPGFSGDRIELTCTLIPTRN
jgi:TonB family protein